MENINLIGVTSNECSGSCFYCVSGINNAIRHSKAELEKIDNNTYRNFQVDFEKMEKAIKSLPEWNSNKRVKITLWSGDPLTNFQITQELFDFANWLCKQRGNYEIHTSTNGLAFIRNEVKEWIKKNNIIVQLSHDGIAQELRTNIDPLQYVDFNVNIACLLHQYNSDLFKNIEYFHNFYKNTDLRPSLRFMKPMSGHYDLPYLNKKGFFNGKYIDELKNKPFGNLYIQNTTYAPHNLDDFLNQYAVYVDRVMKKIITPDGIHWAQYGVNVPYLLKVHNPLKNPTITKCSAFQMGKKEYSPNIDSLGRYTQCNLITADQSVGNPNNIKPNKCNNCKFINSSLCMHCGVMPKDEREECDFLYRLNNLFLFLRRVYLN